MSDLMSEMDHWVTEDKIRMLLYRFLFSKT